MDEEKKIFHVAFSAVLHGRITDLAPAVQLIQQAAMSPRFRFVGRPMHWCRREDDDSMIISGLLPTPEFLAPAGVGLRLE